MTAKLKKRFFDIKPFEVSKLYHQNPYMLRQFYQGNTKHTNLFLIAEFSHAVLVDQTNKIAWMALL